MGLEGTDPVRYEVLDAVATITLDRAETLNSLTIATKEALLACACDFRLATDSARFLTAFAGIGLAVG